MMDSRAKTAEKLGPAPALGLARLRAAGQLYVPTFPFPSSGPEPGPHWIPLGPHGAPPDPHRIPWVSTEPSRGWPWLDDGFQCRNSWESWANHCPGSWHGSGQLGNFMFRHSHFPAAGQSRAPTGSHWIPWVSTEPSRGWPWLDDGFQCRNSWESWANHCPGSWHGSGQLGKFMFRHFHFPAADQSRAPTARYNVFLNVHEQIN